MPEIPSADAKLGTAQRFYRVLPTGTFVGMIDGRLLNRVRVHGMTFWVSRLVDGPANCNGH